MTQTTLSNGITLEYEVHGANNEPVIFVILGITDNITDWPKGLYQPLVEQGFRVVCYELRDSGHSTKFTESGHPNIGQAMALLDNGELPESPYTGHDMAEDAVLLMDHLGIAEACIVGYSYGAMVAQLLTLTYPEKVRALVCLQGSNYDPALPARTPAVQSAMAAATVVYEEQPQKIEAMKNLRLATNGTTHAMAEAEALESATTSVSRTYCPDGTARIVLSRLATPSFYAQSGNISCPTLVLHGDQDPIFPIQHGIDIANRIPDARLKILEGAGHNHPESLQPIIASHITNFLK